MHLWSQAPFRCRSFGELRQDAEKLLACAAILPLRRRGHRSARDLALQLERRELLDAHPVERLEGLDGDEAAVVHQPRHQRVHVLLDHRDRHALGHTQREQASVRARRALVAPGELVHEVAHALGELVLGDVGVAQAREQLAPRVVVHLVLEVGQLRPQQVRVQVQHVVVHVGQLVERLAHLRARLAALDLSEHTGQPLELVLDPREQRHAERVLVPELEAGGEAAEVVQAVAHGGQHGAAEVTAHLRGGAQVFRRQEAQRVHQVVEE
mmetsp:Transcript_24896/g.63197  ORF Transcript_24896/g.63197 Transcript_24896/m.63197 type:complete len:268 (-) Transcript_24896:274-1077(-)